jgi:hypothetical protein
MTVSLTHSTPADGTFSATGATAWDAQHVLTQDTARLLGRTTAGVGATEEISVGTGLSLSGGTLTNTVTATAPGGSDTQIQFNNAGAFGGASGLTTNGTELTIASGTKTASAPVLDMSQTWNNGAVTFTGLKFNAATGSSANSAAGSLLMDLQLEGTSRFSVRKDGYTVINAALINVGSKVGLGIGAGSAAFLQVVSDQGLVWSSTTSVSNGVDLLLTRRAAANLRFGAADVGATTTTVTITIAAPGVVTWTSHGLSTGTPVVFTTTGALPTGITAGTTYYAVVITTSTFQIASSVANAIAATPTVITTSGTQSGTHTGTRYNITQRLSMQSNTGVTDRLGADLIITGSQGTGTGAGGSIIFQVAPAGGTSNAVQNALATALTINGSGNLLLPGGSTSSVALQFSNSDLGFAGILGAANLAIVRLSTSTAVFRVDINGTVGATRSFGIGASVGSEDVILARDAANTLALRNGTNAQTFNVYNTYTSSTNFERFRIVAQSAAAVLIGTEKGSGGGTARALELQTDATSRLIIKTDGLVAFAGTDATFPALKRSSTTLQVRLADDTAFGSIQAQNVTAQNNVNAANNFVITGYGSLSTTNTNGQWKIMNAAGSVGVVLDVTTTSVASVRPLSGSGYGTLDAQLRSQGTAPAANNSTGTAGDIRYDVDYIYICTATDTWKRVAIATWP